MNASLWSIAALALVATHGTGCNTPSCGAGTKQVQDDNGDLHCVSADAVAPLGCLADGGTQLIAGNCVATLACGPNTVPEVQADGSTLCVAVAVGGGGSCVPSCGTPQPGTICVDGQVRHLVDGSSLSPGEMVHVALYDPLSFLGDPGTTPLAESDTACGFKFDNVPYPPSMLVVVAVSDAGKRGLLTVTHQLTGTGAAVVAQQAYRVDSYAVPKSVVSGWSAAAGIDYDAAGAVVLEFFADMKPPPTDLEANETLPVAGVTLYQDSAPADGLNGHAAAKYFGASLTKLDASLTATGAAGGAIVAVSPASGAFPIFSGMGGTSMGKPIGWESSPGGSTAHVLFVERMHPM
jgi:hypothetical protein